MPSPFVLIFTKNVLRIILMIGMKPKNCAKSLRNTILCWKSHARNFFLEVLLLSKLLPIIIEGFQ